MAIPGCGGCQDRREVEGTVTLDGRPLAEGYIIFVPKPGTKSTAGGVNIKDGKFTVPADKGLGAGNFTVEITAGRKTGKTSAGFMGDKVDDVVQFLPDRYNRQSILTAEVKDAGPNEFTFELKSKTGN